MSLSLALLVSDRKLVQCVCHLLNKDLEALQSASLADASQEGERQRGSATAHLGVGYYDQGEVLLSRRPLTSETPLTGLMCRFQSSALLAHVTVDPIRSFRPVETQPYRYRDWLWVHSGDIQERPGFDRNTLAIPTYIRSNIRSWQPQEVIFHLFLSFLHRTGTLGSLHWDRTATRRALSSALSFVPSLYQSESGEPPSYAVVATNGEFLMGVGVGRDLFYRRVDGIDPCGLCTDRRRVSPGDARAAVSHPHLKAVVMSALPVPSPGDASAWTQVPARTILEVDGAMGIEHGPLA